MLTSLELLESLERGEEQGPDQSYAATSDSVKLVPTITASNSVRVRSNGSSMARDSGVFFLAREMFAVTAFICRSVGTRDPRSTSPGDRSQTVR